METKYGVIIYCETTNIGDDIQSYAAARFFPKIDYALDRENLDTFCSHNGEIVKTIMNGWYMHKKWNWPPNKCIWPLFLAFNYSEEAYFYYDKHYKSVFLEGEGGNYLKYWGSIGCRDLDTTRLLSSKGISAFFSGCLTLTLPRNELRQPENYICIVDIDKNAERIIENRAKDEGVYVRKITHSIPRYGKDVPWSVRAKNVEKLLTTYQKARCVVTSRLHCALPCLAMGVPVLLVRDDLSDKRFQPYIEWMETATPEQIIFGEYAYSFANPPHNNEKHVPYREEMISRIQEFLKSSGKEYVPYDDNRIHEWQLQATKSVLERSVGDAKTLEWKLRLAKGDKKAPDDDVYKEEVLSQFASGQIGFKYISKYIRAWLMHKLARK